MRGGQRNLDKGKVVSLAKKRRQKRRMPFFWLRLIQVVGILSVFLLLYNGVAGLIHLNESYIEKTLLPARKVSAAESPEAKQFAVDASCAWLLGSRTGLPGKYYFQSIDSALAGEVKNDSQYKGTVDVHVAGSIYGKMRRVVVRVPLEYNPAKKAYRVYDTPAVKEEN